VLAPHAEYTERHTRWRAEFERRTSEQKRLGTARLWTGIALAAVSSAAFGPGWISSVWLALPAAVLVVLIAMHPSRERARLRSGRLAAFYERGLARLENRWAGTGPKGERWSDPEHIYAGDLDLFGRGSLFEFLSQARTATGERTLAGWLLKPGVAEDVRARQQAVAELSGRLELREDLAVLGEDIRAALDDRELAVWGSRPAVRFFAGARVVAVVLALAAVAAGIAWFLGKATLRPFLYVAALEILFTWAIRHSIEAVTGAVNTPARDLGLIATLLERLERESFTSPALVALHERLRAGSGSATDRIRTLERLVEWKDWAHNQIFGVISAPLLWVPQFAMAIEAWRRECGPHIAGWIAAVGEFEALASLAAFSYERPEAVFPELLGDGEPRYEASALAHPLIDPREAVANDVALGGQERLWIVSGSNMSGKSTLLRAVGVSVVLAWAGAPVIARGLRLTKLEIGASLRANDSLADHRSRFFAEIVRLKQIVDAASRGPVLFLLDELLSGTNSHDRRIGAQALIQGLLARGAIGLATTHDLALAEIGANMGPVARNVHFEDQFAEGKMKWDYKLRPGVVERGNAIELMRAVGLDV
jgi:hypothetical protein